MKNNLSRRAVIAGASFMGLAAPFVVSGQNKSKLNVLIIGGGYAGSTAARYLRLFGGDNVNISIIDNQAKYVCGPLSNLALTRNDPTSLVTIERKALVYEYKVNYIVDFCRAINIAQRKVILSNVGTLDYDKLIIAPGAEYDTASIEGLADGLREEQIFAAFNNSSIELENYATQFANIPAGDIYVSLPKGPLKGQYAAYERVFLLAEYLQKNKLSKNKIFLLDANGVNPLGGYIFEYIVNNLYYNQIVHLPNTEILRVNGRAKTIYSRTDTFKGVFMNVVPGFRAPKFLVEAGLMSAKEKYVPVQGQFFHAKGQKNIHVIGDAVNGDENMPKLAIVANGQAKVVAAQIIGEMAKFEVDELKLFIPATDYIFASKGSAMLKAHVNQWDVLVNKYRPIVEPFAISSYPSPRLAVQARTVYENMLLDSFGI